MLRLVALVGRDQEVALAAVQGLVDLLVQADIVIESEFNIAVSRRLTDILEARANTSSQT